MYVLLSLIRCVLCEHVVLTAGNIDSLIAKSYSIPVIMYVYSSYCGHCMVVRPTWLEIAQEYSHAQDIILVEANMANESKTITRIANINGYPAIYKIMLGKVEQVRVEHSFNDLHDFVEKMRKTDPLDDCHVYKPSGMYVSGPLFVFPLTGTVESSCRTANTRCIEAGINPSRCTVSNDRPMNCSLNVIYGDDGNVCIDDSVGMMREYSYDPFGNWPLHSGLKLSRRMLVVVYKEESHWREFVPLQKQFAKDFLIGKMEHEEFVRKARMSVPVADLPLVLASNPKKSHFVMWKHENIEHLAEKLEKIEEWDKEMNLGSSFLRERIWDNSRKWALAIGSCCVCVGFGSLAILVISQKKLVNKKE